MKKKPDLSSHTPIIRQYLSTKADYPDRLLFCRLGDFYELFFEDAERASKLLDLTLTQRGFSAGIPVKMAGVPVTNLETYLARLLKMGESAVILEQIGTSENAKGLIERKVSRIVTPGTVSDAALLDERQNAYLLAIFPAGKVLGLARLNLASSELIAEECTVDDLESALFRIRPSEVLYPEECAFLDEKFVAWRFAKKKIAPWHFEVESASRLLCEQFRVKDLNVFGLNGHNAAIAATGALIYYARLTQKQELSHIDGMAFEAESEYLGLDFSTRRNLELTETLRGEKSPTLFSLLDKCQTNAGSRFLRQLLQHPKRNIEEAIARHEAIDYFLNNSIFDILNQAFKGLADIERIAARIALKNARPRDLSGLKESLKRLEIFQNRLPAMPAIFQNIKESLNVPSAVFNLLNQIADEPAAFLRDGGVIAAGVDKELDECRALNENHGDFLLQLEKSEQKRTGIANLKVEYNRVHGFYIEVGKAAAAKVPLDYQRRSTLKNAERFITPELKSFEDKALSAKSRALMRERVLYEAILEKLKPFINPLNKAAKALAELDTLLALAQTAQYFQWTRPIFVDDIQIQIEGARHPVVESERRRQNDAFIKNDVLLNQNRQMLLITGPNMGGKSTYMRQVALIVLLAKIGAFVPATAAKIGPIDHIFTRIGASDDLASGQSTFMVEMTEAAAILRSANAHSLVLMDEIGRGTATLDGLALAKAILTYLLKKNKSLALFATHYFELTDLAQFYKPLANVHLGAVKTQDKIVFLHQLKNGPANKSYGIEVAGLSGMPAAVLKDARRYSKELEKQQINLHQGDLLDCVPNLTEPPIITELRNLSLNDMTPKAALNFLFDLQKRLKT